MILTSIAPGKMQRGIVGVPARGSGGAPSNSLNTVSSQLDSLDSVSHSHLQAFAREYPVYQDYSSLSLQNLLREAQQPIVSARGFGGRVGQADSAFAQVREGGAGVRDVIEERFKQLEHRSAMEEWRAFVDEYPVPGDSVAKSAGVVPKIDLGDGAAGTSAVALKRVPDGTPPHPSTTQQHHSVHHTAALSSRQHPPLPDEVPPPRPAAAPPPPPQKYRDGRYLDPLHEDFPHYRDGRPMNELALLLHRKEAEAEVRRREREELARRSQPPAPGSWAGAVASEEALISSQLVERVLFGENWHKRRFTAKHLDADFLWRAWCT